MITVTFSRLPMKGGRHPIHSTHPSHLPFPIHSYLFLLPDQHLGQSSQGQVSVQGYRGVYLFSTLSRSNGRFRLLLEYTASTREILGLGFPYVFEIVPAKDELGYIVIAVYFLIKWSVSLTSGVYCVHP